MSFITQIGNKVKEVGEIVKKTYGPLSALEQSGSGTNYTMSNLRYPLDVGDSNQYPHTVEFQCFIPIGTGIGPTVAAPGELMPEAGGRRAKGVLDTRQRNAAGEIDLLSNINEKFNTRVTDINRRVKVSDLIALYIPQGAWNDSHGNDYQTKSVTDALGGAGLAVEAVSSLVDLFKSDPNKVKNLLGAGTKLATETGIRAGVGIGNALGVSMDADTLVGVGLAATGYAINPQYEVLYSASQMRQFSFDFTMTPRNRAEAQSCINIVKRFKYHASPQYTQAGGGRYLIPPSYFNIQLKYMGKLNPYLPLISTCVLDKIDVNYSSGLEQFTTYKDGMPIQINMVLMFTEIEMQHKALRDEGY